MTTQLIYAKDWSTEGMDHPIWALSFSRVTDDVGVHLGTICTEAESPEAAFNQCIESGVCPFLSTDDDQECMVIGPIERALAPDHQPFDVLMTFEDMDALSLDPIRVSRDTHK